MSAKTHGRRSFKASQDMRSGLHGGTAQSQPRRSLEEH
jgi:hypothetical protein